MYVKWGRAVSGNVEGVRLTFVFDQFEDEYEFFDGPDVDFMLKMVTTPGMEATLLLMHVRDRLCLTVH